MAKYRKKPVVIEAFRFAVDPFPVWFMDAINNGKVNLITQYDGSHECTIYTLEGIHYAYAGDYIIKGVKGELYPCKSDIFEMTYEAI